jgi:hypothetical protein
LRKENQARLALLLLNERDKEGEDAAPGLGRGQQGCAGGSAVYLVVLWSHCLVVGREECTVGEKGWEKKK